MSTRDTILQRIREALSAPVQGHAHAAPVHHAEGEARQWLPAVGATSNEWLTRFEQQAAVLKAEFVVVGSVDEAHLKLREIAASDGWKRFATHEGMLTSPLATALGLPVLQVAPGYDVKEFEACDAGITECDALVAQTGSVLLTARSGGGRALSVLPPHHIVIARHDQLVPDLPAAYALLHERYDRAWPSMMTLITGASRTGDIERILVLGAHGPKKLTIILIHE